MAAAGLRRRFFGASPPPSPSPVPTPAGFDVKTIPEDLKLITTEKLDKLKKGARKSQKKRFTIFFVLGGLFGLLVAGFFAQQQDIIKWEGLLDLNLDSLMDVLPPGLIKDAKALTQHERDAVAYDSFAVGLHLQSQGIKAHHPVIMVPGVISTGLESWGTEENSRQYFRKRLWGSWNMMRALVTDKAGWKRHIMLDKMTGLDPPGIKLRAAQGFDATDFFITGYWIWNKILENLATIGYDPGNAFTASYDWRLTYQNLEIRDQYFTRLQHYIEVAVKASGKKSVILTHSMGSQVFFYFMAWVEAEGHGNGGSDWVNTYIEAWVNISGCLLGALKDVPAVLSGEMKDTAQLNAFAVYGLEKFLSKEERAEIFRAMPGISSMLPKGGDAVWGNQTWAPDDMPDSKVSFGSFLNFKESNGTSTHKNLTMSQSLQYLWDHSDEWYQDQIGHAYSHGVAHTSAEIESNMKIPRKWVNPLETRLPKAPNMKIYCFYGVGKDTERSYFYREDLDPLSQLNVTIDTTVTKDNIMSGVVMGEGDGTVNLLSSGYMCTKGWHLHRYNPSNITIKVHEMPHEPDRFSPRGGPNTGDHVDILGRASLNDLILRVAGGKGEEIEENVVSNIREYSDKVQIFEEPEYETKTTFAGILPDGLLPEHPLASIENIIHNIEDSFGSENTTS